jgi:undecaprenyl-diphosphatase
MEWTALSLYDFGIAALLGVVEGITEFLPISSTGHLILLVDMLGFRGPPGHVFEVVIQFGAIVGVCWVYRDRLMRLAANPLTASSRHLLALLMLGFLPAAMIGLVAHGFIKSMLFNPWVVSIALIGGGVAIIAIERIVATDRVKSLDEVTLGTGLGIGFFQALAMIPGTSRSAATIMGARVLGLARGVAAEFSFLLAIPTMLAASAYDLYKNAATIDADGTALLVTGFVCALVTSVLTVRWLVGFVSSHSFSSFGWYRIGLGGLMLALLSQGWG